MRKPKQKARKKVPGHVKHVPVIAVDVAKGTVHVIPVPHTEVKNPSWWASLFGTSKQ